MNHISELRTILSDFFPWNKARLTCLIHILIALFRVRTVNLTQIAAAFEADCKEESTYRRVRRFFTEFTFDLSSIAPFVLKLFPLQEKCTLILDRTNWKWGKTPINILMLSIGYKGISIPFFWSVLDLEGNSCVEDRKQLFLRAFKKFPAEKIEVFLADREFAGKEWFKFLIDSKIPFVIRLRRSFNVEMANEESTSIRRLLKKFGMRKKVLNLHVRMWERELYLSFRKGKKGAKEPMVLISNIEFKDALKIYKKRWEIETLFGCLKGRGFRLEDTHITDPNKIEKLIFVVALAFCWAYRKGEIKSGKIPIKTKSHGRKAKSLFREGLDQIRRVFMRGRSKIDDLSEILFPLKHLISEGCGV